MAVTHDPLLTYRLIHCCSSAIRSPNARGRNPNALARKDCFSPGNWNSSELFLCRDGFLWKQRNFSSHSLKAFQELRGHPGGLWGEA